MRQESLPKDYRDALKGVVLLQLVIGVLALIAMTDLFFDLWWRSMAAYWGVLFVIFFKRPHTVTKVDLFVVKYGFFLLLLFITPVLSILLGGLVQ